MAEAAVGRGEGEGVGPVRGVGEGRHHRAAGVLLLGNISLSNTQPIVEEACSRQCGHLPVAAELEEGCSGAQHLRVLLMTGMCGTLSTT